MGDRTDSRSRMLKKPRDLKRVLRHEMLLGKMESKEGISS